MHSREVLFCAELREMGYSLLHIIAGRCPETGTYDTIYLFEQHLSSLAPVSLWGR